MNLKEKISIGCLFIIGMIIVGAIVFFTTKNSFTEEMAEIERQRNIAWKGEANLLLDKEDLNAKFTKALDELQSASKKIEELETELSYTKEENEALKEENKYLTEICEYVYNGHWNYDYTQEDIDILAAVMYAENYISGRWEMMITGSVVLNRVLSRIFPNSIYEVVYQIDGKYEQYAKRTKNLIGTQLPEECYELAEILLKYGPVVPPNVLYQAHFKQGPTFWHWKGEFFCYSK